MILINEETLFKLLKRMISDLERTSQFSYLDAYSRKYNLTLELKCRKTHYQDMLIEKYKWDNLIRYKNIRYVNSTPKGVFSFDLKGLAEPEWKDHKMPKQTEFDNRNLVFKKVGYLPIEDAKEITFLLFNQNEYLIYNI